MDFLFTKRVAVFENNCEFLSIETVNCPPSVHSFLRFFFAYFPYLSAAALFADNNYRCTVPFDTRSVLMAFQLYT